MSLEDTPRCNECEHEGKIQRRYSLAYVVNPRTRQALLHMKWQQSLLAHLRDPVGLRCSRFSHSRSSRQKIGLERPTRSYGVFATQSSPWMSTTKKPAEHSSTSATTSPRVLQPQPVLRSLMQRSSIRLWDLWRTSRSGWLYAPIEGVPRLMGFPEAAYKNNADGSSQRGQCRFICQLRNKERDTRGSLIDYESH